MCVSCRIRAFARRSRATSRARPTRMTEWAPVTESADIKSLATSDDIMPSTPNNDTAYSAALSKTDEGMSFSSLRKSWIATGRSTSPSVTYGEPALHRQVGEAGKGCRHASRGSGTLAAPAFFGVASVWRTFSEGELWFRAAVDQRAVRRRSPSRANASTTVVSISEPDALLRTASASAWLLPGR
jgi:hypothetical protein